MSNKQNGSQNMLTPLEAFYQRELQQATEIAFVQPYPDGSVRNFSWQDVGDLHSPCTP
jgi:hypothetical protein